MAKIEKGEEDMPLQSSACWELWQTVFGSPRYIAAPMVDMSELPFRMLCRRYGAQLCFTPMLHASHYVNDAIYRRKAFTTCQNDRPLIVQFCANDAEVFAQAAVQVARHCDGVDLNLGCPQVIAKRGQYGAFLQEEWNLIAKMVKAASHLSKLPISCKIRIFQEKDRTIQYAKMLEASGCTFLTIHGRTRDQKGKSTGLADWDTIKAVKASVRIPVIANGNILNFADVDRCLQYTGVNAVMSAEGLLHNPALFSSDNPPVWQIAEEFLDLCKEYPIDHGHIRTHLFRLWAYCLPLHPDLQDALGQANSLEKLQTICSEVRARLLAMQSQHKLQLHNILHTEAEQVLTPGDEEEKHLATHGCIDSSEESAVTLNVAMETSNTKDGQNFDSVGSVMGQCSSQAGSQVTVLHCGVTDELPVWLCHSRPRVKLDQHNQPIDCSSIIPVVAEDAAGSLKEGQLKKLTRSQKKKLRIQQKLEGQKLRRKHAKVQRKQRRAEEREQLTKGSDSDSVGEHMSKRQRQQLIHERSLAAMETGQRMCVDLSMETLMSKKECSKLAQQLGRVYGSNRHAECPVHLFFSGLNKGGFLYAECLRKNAGFVNYLVDVTEESHLKLFRHEDIIQLSPDSPNVLQTIEPDKVYVLGGLVDESILKGVTKGRAEQANVSTARLPIQEYMQKADQGTFKKVLSINQVFDILLTYMETKDWGSALLAGMPPRQGYVLKSQSPAS